MKPVRIKVPASTSNLGSGFDTLGLAVNLHTELKVARGEAPEVRISMDMPESARSRLLNVLTEAAQSFFRASDSEPFGVEVALCGNVPIARGLGYSATLRVGLLAALNELSQAGHSRQWILKLATQLEHHPDNASPSIFGGFTVSGLVNSEVRCLHFAVSERLKLVTVIPDFPISTEEARQRMPASYSKADCAHALNRSALITAAMASGNFDLLRGIFDDRTHQPYREPLIPELCKVIAAGEAAGALGGFLSGSGSAIICLTLENTEGIGKAMMTALPRSQLLVLTVDNTGYTVT